MKVRQAREQQVVNDIAGTRAALTQYLGRVRQRGQLQPASRQRMVGCGNDNTWEAWVVEPLFSTSAKTSSWRRVMAIASVIQHFNEITNYNHFFSPLHHFNREPSKMSENKFIGAHVSAAGGVDQAVARAHDLKATAFALFTKNQRQWKAAALTASIPPTSPGVRPGRSAIEKAMKPAKTGTMSVRADLLPISINAAAKVPGLSAA